MSIDGDLTDTGGSPRREGQQQVEQSNGMRVKSKLASRDREEIVMIKQQVFVFFQGRGSGCHEHGSFARVLLCSSCLVSGVVAQA